MSCDFFDDFFLEETEDNDFFSSDKSVKTGYAFLFLAVFVWFLSYIEYIDGWYFTGAVFLVIGILLIKNKITSVFVSDENDDELNGIVEIFFDCIDKNVLPEAKRVFLAGDFIGDDDIYVFPVPVYGQKNIAGEPVIKIKNDDGSYFYSLWEINVLITGKSYLGYFSCIFNLKDKSIKVKATNEFYYSDISSVRNETTEEFFPDKNNDKPVSVNVNKFIVSNSSGDKTEFIAEIPSANIPANITEKINESLTNLRLKIRKKRFPEEYRDKYDDIDFEIEDTGKND